MKKIVLLTLFFAWLALPSCRDPEGDGDGDADSDADGDGESWTFLVYMMADNNLEPDGVDDLGEMITTGSTENSHIVIEADRHSDYSDGDVGGLAAWTGTKRLIARQGSLEEIQDLGETDQATPESLATFIEWGVSSYPADRYALIMWNHGMAWPGFGDDEASRTHMTLPQLSQGISDGLSRAGLAQFNLLGFDACLMANLEVMDELAQTAHYIVASEETEPGHGWDYAPITELLAQNPRATSVELANRIVDSYSAQARTEGTDGEITLSVIETSAIDSLVSAVNDLGLALADGVDTRESWMPVALVRSRVEEYGRAANPDDSSNVIDLLHFLDRLEFYDGEDLENQINGVRSAAQSAIVRSINSEQRPHASGLTLYFPDSESAYNSNSGAYGQTSFGSQNGWADLLAAYQATAQSDVTAPSLDPLDYKPGKTVFEAYSAIGMDVDDLAAVYFFLGVPMGSDTILLASVPTLPDDEGYLGVEWDYRSPTLSDGASNIWAAIMIEFSTVWDMIEGGDSHLDGVIPIEAQDPQGQWHSGFVRVAWDVASGALSARGTYVTTEGGIGQLQPPAGTTVQIRAVYPIITDSGELVFEADEDPAAQLSFGSTPLSIVEQEVPKGEYNFGFFAEDYSGNVGVASAFDYL